MLYLGAKESRRIPPASEGTTRRVLVDLHQQAFLSGRVTSGVVTDPDYRSTVVESAEDCRILSSLR
jgi:hypothetical protein